MNLFSEFTKKYNFGYLDTGEDVKREPIGGALLGYFRRPFTFNNANTTVVTLSKDFSNFLNSLEEKECARFVHCLAEQTFKTVDGLWCFHKGNQTFLLSAYHVLGCGSILHVEKRG